MKEEIICKLRNGGIRSYDLSKKVEAPKDSDYSSCPLNLLDFLLNRKLYHVYFYVHVSIFFIFAYVSDSLLLFPLFFSHSMSMYLLPSMSQAQFEIGYMAMKNSQSPCPQRACVLMDFKNLVAQFNLN